VLVIEAGVARQPDSRGGAIPASRSLKSVVHDL
jgi:hypothetical protein